MRLAVILNNLRTISPKAALNNSQRRPLRQICTRTMSHVTEASHSKKEGKNQIRATTETTRNLGSKAKLSLCILKSWCMVDGMLFTVTSILSADVCMYVCIMRIMTTCVHAGRRLDVAGYSSVPFPSRQHWLEPKNGIGTVARPDPPRLMEKGTLSDRRAVYFACVHMGGTFFVFRLKGCHVVGLFCFFSGRFEQI